MTSLLSNMDRLESNLRYFKEQLDRTGDTIEDFSLVINDTVGLREEINSAIKGMKLFKKTDYLVNKEINYRLLIIEKKINEIIYF